MQPSETLTCHFLPSPTSSLTVPGTFGKFPRYFAVTKHAAEAEKTDEQP